MFSESSRRVEAASERARRNIFFCCCQVWSHLDTDNKTARIYLRYIENIMICENVWCDERCSQYSNIFYPTAAKSASSRQRNLMLRARKDRENQNLVGLGYLIRIWKFSIRSINVVWTRRCHILYFIRRSVE